MWGGPSPWSPPLRNTKSMSDVATQIKRDGSLERTCQTMNIRRAARRCIAPATTDDGTGSVPDPGCLYRNRRTATLPPRNPADVCTREGGTVHLDVSADTHEEAAHVQASP